MGGKRANQDGSVFQSGGKWYCQLSPDPITGKRPKRVAKTQKEARTLLKQMQADRDRGADVGAAYPLLEDELMRWLTNTKKPEISAKTYQSYQQMIQLYICPHMPRKGKIRINEVRASHAEHMRNEILASTKTVGTGDDARQVPLSTRTAQLAVTILAQAFDVFVERYHLPRNEIRLLKPLKQVKAPIKVLSEEQIVAFIEVIDDHRLKFLFYLSLTFGFRIGELLGLLWRDLDLEQKTVCISGTLQDLKTGPARKNSPKTEAGFRTLPLTDSLVALGHEHLEQTHREYAIRTQAWSLHEPVFTSESGTFIWHRNFSTMFGRLLKKAGIPTTTRVHDLRHTVVTTLLNQGQPLAVVSKYVGHSSLRVTSDLYLHRDSKAELKVASAMEAILKKRPADTL